MNIKKLLALALAFLMALSCACFISFADDPSEVTYTKEITLFTELLEETRITTTATSTDIYLDADNGCSINDGTWSGTFNLCLSNVYASITKVEIKTDAEYIENWAEKDGDWITWTEKTFNVSFTLENNTVDTIKVTYSLPIYDITSESSLSGQGGVTFKVNNAAVTKASPGDLVTATATSVTDYFATLSSSDEIFLTNKDGVATFIMPSKAVNVKSTYTPGTYLDLETGGYPDSKNIDQKYKYEQNSGTTYTDITKVKVEWTLPEISVSYASKKTWNPDTMSWDETKNTSTIGEKTATFTLTNYSSIKIAAQVTFKRTIVTDTNTYKSDVCYLDTFVNDDSTRSIKSSCTNTGAIQFKFTPVASDFAAAAASGVYGTYTVAIKKAPDVVYVMTGDNANSHVLTSDDLLKSSNLTYNTNLIAYNGYISETSGANLTDATEFIRLLNEANVKPSGQTSGSWRLLNSKDDADAWFAASSSTTTYGVVDSIWSSVPNGSGVGDLYRCYLEPPEFAHYKSGNVPSMGFVAVWDPNPAA